MGHVPISRTKRTLFLSLAVVSIITLLVLLAYPHRDDFSDTYNPLTYNRDRASWPLGTSTKSEYDKLLEPVTPLFNDEELQKRLVARPDAACSVYTFFNDDKIRRLSLDEQQFHRGLLRKWVLLFQSLGFNVHIMHYNDAVKNPRMKDMADRRVLFGKNDIINENYLKLLAWSQRMADTPAQKGKGALYADYTIFPANYKIGALKDECPKIRDFHLVPDYEFQVMLGSQKSVVELVDALIQKNKDFNIVEQPKYAEIFADYTVATWLKLLNTNNVKKVVDTLPGLLDKHTKMWRFGKFEALNVVDAMAVGDHYFARGILQGLKALLQCEDVAYPPPTKTFIDMFDREIKPRLPDRPGIDSELEKVQLAEKVLADLMVPHSYKCSEKQWIVTLEDHMKLKHKTLNLVPIPHPLSSASVLKFEDKRMVTSTDLVTMQQRDVITDLLLEKTKSINKLHQQASHPLNSIFFPAELLTVETFAHAVSIYFGVDIPAKNDQWGMKYTDLTTSFSERSGNTFTISEGELKWKLDSAKALIANYEQPHPYVINQRQSQQKLLEYRRDLKLIKKPEKLENPKLVLQTQNFESRHDPVVEIAEAWNQQDTALWWLVKSVRWVDEEILRLLAEVHGI